MTDKHDSAVIFLMVVLTCDHTKYKTRTKVKLHSSKLIGKILHMKVGVTAEVVAVVLRDVCLLPTVVLDCKNISDQFSE